MMDEEKVSLSAVSTMPATNLGRRRIGIFCGQENKLSRLGLN